MFGSIYGPGVLNDTIVPGYGITKFPVNLNTFWSLPNGTIRNFGESSQYTTYRMGYPSIMYQLGRNFTDPNHISNWNPLLIGTGIDFSNNNTTNPYLTQKGQMLAFQKGYNMAEQMMVQQAVQEIAGALNSMESSLTNIVKSDKLTSAQKATLNSLLEQVKALKEKIAKQLKDKNPTKEEVTAMQKEVLDLQKKVSEAAEKINTDVQGGSESTTPSTSSTDTTNTADVEDAELLKDSKYKDINPKTGKPTSLTEPAEGETEQFCAAIDKAIKGAFTDLDTLKETLPGITASNVIEIVNQWKDTRRGNLFGELLDDLSDGEQQEMIPQLLNALKDRASALGIYDEIKVEYSKVNQELAQKRNCINWIWGAGQDDNVIETNLLAICTKIEKKEKENKEGAEKVIKNKKADNKKKTNEKQQETITEKKCEIANKLKEALKLDKVPELSSALKVETDDNGDFTGYSIKVNVKGSGQLTLKGTTYQELILELEKHGLEAQILIKKDIKA